MKKKLVAYSVLFSTENLDDPKKLYVKFLNEDYIEKHKHYLSFSISIDGNKELHDSCRVFEDGSGSYDKAMAAALHFAETAQSFNTKITVSPDNV